ncbi:MAG TPA: hypothetical protein VN223_02160 [Candidatus Elarobacter sp.]|nr:hypothetical protein [Candidatus Elarobacter sp.]
MEPETFQKRDFGSLLVTRVNTVLIPIVATLAVGVTIALHWRVYDGISKFLGLVLLLNLGIGLWLTFQKTRQAEKASSVSLAQIAYTSLLLATILFTR